MHEHGLAGSTCRTSAAMHSNRFRPRQARLCFLSSTKMQTTPNQPLNMQRASSISSAAPGKIHARHEGLVGEWLSIGLQIRLLRFDSGRGLHKPPSFAATCSGRVAYGPQSPKKCNAFLRRYPCGPHIRPVVTDIRLVSVPCAVYGYVWLNLRVMMRLP